MAFEFTDVLFSHFWVSSFSFGCLCFSRIRYDPRCYDDHSLTTRLDVVLDTFSYFKLLELARSRGLCCHEPWLTSKFLWRDTKRHWVMTNRTILLLSSLASRRGLLFLQKTHVSPHYVYSSNSTIYAHPDWTRRIFVFKICFFFFLRCWSFCHRLDESRHRTGRQCCIFNGKVEQKQACYLPWKIKGMMRFRASVMKRKEGNAWRRRAYREEEVQRAFPWICFICIYYSDVGCC